MRRAAGVRPGTVSLSAVQMASSDQGLAAQDAHGALSDMQLMARGARSGKPIFHVMMNPREGEQLDDAQWRRAWEAYEAEYGLQGQPYVEVEHVKGGRTHRHRAYYRIDDDGKAINASWNKARDEKVARCLEHDFGHQMTKGAHNERVAAQLRKEGRLDVLDWMNRGGAREEARPVATLTHKEWQQQRRTGMDADAIRAEVFAAWQSADTGKAFAAALEERGLSLAKGDKANTWVVVDANGGTHEVGRALRAHVRAAGLDAERVKAADVRARLKDLDGAALPGVGEATDAQHRRMADQLGKVDEQQAAPKSEPPKKVWTEEELAAWREQQAADRRRQREQRADQARDRLPRVEGGGRRPSFKLALLAEAYGKELPPHLAADLAWVNTRQRAGEVVVQLRSGTRLRDDGQRIMAQGAADDRAIAVMIEMAKAKGWSEVRLTGSEDFKRAAAEAAARAGLGVLNPELAQHVDQARRQPAPADLDQVRERTAEARKPRPAMSDAEILEKIERQRRFLQPEWGAADRDMWKAQKSYEWARDNLRTATNRRQADALARKMEEARRAYDRAAERAMAHDQPWQDVKRQAFTEAKAREEARRQREAARLAREERAAARERPSAEQLEQARRRNERIRDTARRGPKAGADRRQDNGLDGALGAAAGRGRPQQDRPGAGIGGPDRGGATGPGAGDRGPARRDRGLDRRGKPLDWPGQKPDQAAPAEAGALSARVKEWMARKAAEEAAAKNGPTKPAEGGQEARKPVAGPSVPKPAPKPPASSQAPQEGKKPEAPKSEPPKETPRHTLLDDIEWAEAGVADLEAEEKALKAAAWETTWRGPDGQWRELSTKAYGYHGQIPNHMKHDEAARYVEATRDRRQPEWKPARDAHADRLVELRKAEKAYQDLGFFGRLGQGGTDAKAEIAARQRAVDQAAKQLGRLDQAWEKAKPGQVAMVLDQAREMRDKVAEAREPAQNRLKSVADEIKARRDMAHTLRRIEKAPGSPVGSSDRDRLEHIRRLAEEQRQREALERARQQAEQARQRPGQGPRRGGGGGPTMKFKPR